MYESSVIRLSGSMWDMIEHGSVRDITVHLSALDIRYQHTFFSHEI